MSGSDVRQWSSTRMPLSHAMPGFRCEFGVRNDADADDHQIGRNAFARFGEHRFDVAVLAGEPRDLGAGANVHAATGVQAVIERAHRRCRDALQNALFHFEHGDGEAGRDRDRRDFEADVTAAGDGDVLAGAESGADRIDVGDRAQVVDARQIAAGNVEAPRAAAGGDQQFVVLDCRRRWTSSPCAPSDRSASRARRDAA